MMSLNNCEGKEIENGRPNVRIFVMQSLKSKTPRIRAGHGGRKGRRCENAKKTEGFGLMSSVSGRAKQKKRKDQTLVD